MSRRFKSRLQRVVLWGMAVAIAGFLASPFVRAGAWLLGRALSPEGASTGVVAAWPADGQSVGTLVPTLRWPGGGSERYEVTLHRVQEGGETEWLCSFETTVAQLALPDGLLDADATYQWTVTGLEGGASAVLYAGRFSTLTRLSVSGLQVEPAVYPLNIETLLHGMEMRVEVPEGVRVQVLLPEVLTAGGRTKVAAVGSVRVLVRPSLAVARAVAVRGGGGGGVGEIRVTDGARALLVPVVLDVSAMGALVKAVDSGFDPVLDTPGFSNFASGLLATFTQGTCLGMVLAAQARYRECRDCMREGACVCARMRMRSLLAPEATKREMNFLHLANLDPQNLSGPLTAAVGEGEPDEVAAEVMSVLAEGDPVPLAMLDHGAAGGQEAGHAVLVYAGQEYDDAYLLFAYDPDEVAMAGDPAGTFLVVWRVGADAGKVLYARDGSTKWTDVFPLAGAEVLEEASEVLSDSFSALDMNITKAIAGEK